MKIVFYNPSPIHLRYNSFNTIKGNPFFLKPNYDAMRIAHLSRGHEFVYYDERIEEQPNIKPDLLVVHLPITTGDHFIRSRKDLWPAATPTVLYGLYPTIFFNEAVKSGATAVKGDIAAVWPRILADTSHGRLQKSYTAFSSGPFATSREAELKPGYTRVFSQMRTSFGCHCAETERDYCPESILYRQYARWPIEEASREIGRLKRKVVYLIDDDFLYDRDYAVNLLDKTWHYKKMWILKTRCQLFNDPALLPVLQEHGVRIIYIKEDWLSGDLTRRIKDRSYIKHIKHQIDLVHNHRIIVGTYLRLGYENEDPDFYQLLDRFLAAIRIDLVEFPVNTPLPRTSIYRQHLRAKAIITDPALFDLWSPVVKIKSLSSKTLYSLMETTRDNFYALDSILRRGMIVSQKLGVYNSVFFFLIPNLSYRNNFLEKVGYPP